MCGLTGVISNQLDYLEMMTFEDLMRVHTLRGEDGSGFAAVPVSEKVGPKVFKRVATPFSLLRDGDWVKLRNGDHKLSVLMGHTRYATTGSYNLSDTHPHKVNHIVGCHNGTLSVVRGREMKKNQNDSAQLFHDIANNGPEQTLKTSVGSIAMTYINTRDETITFYRNPDRTLYLAYHEDDGPTTIFWGSEVSMLSMTFARSAYTGKFKIVQLPPFELWVFKLRNPNDRIKVADRIVLQGEKERYDAHRAAVEKARQEQLKKQQDEWKKNNPVQTSGVPLLPAPAYGDPATGDNLVECYETKKGFKLSYPDLEKAIAHGCKNCDSPATRMEYFDKKLHWVTPKEYICGHCYEHDETARTWADMAAGKTAAQEA